MKWRDRTIETAGSKTGGMPADENLPVSLVFALILGLLGVLHDLPVAFLRLLVGFFELASGCK